MTRRHFTEDDLTREELIAIARALLRKVRDADVFLNSTDIERRPKERITGYSDGTPDYPSMHVALDGALSGDEVSQILTDADDGTDPLVDRPVWEVTWEVVPFVTEAGHTIHVYNRGGAWRYVDHVVHADGRTWDYQDGTQLPGYTNPGDWEPDDPRRWGLPPMTEGVTATPRQAVSHLSPLLARIRGNLLGRWDDDTEGG